MDRASSWDNPHERFEVELINHKKSNPSRKDTHWGRRKLNRDTFWTEMDIDDLKAAIESGSSIDQAAQFLCRG